MIPTLGTNMLYQVYIMLYLEHVVVEEVTVWKVWVPGHCYQIGAQVERDLHSSVKDSLIVTTKS